MPCDCLCLGGACRLMARCCSAVCGVACCWDARGGREREREGMDARVDLPLAARVEWSGVD